MKVKFHLTVNENGSVRVSKGKPDLKWDEVSIEMNLQIPDLLFQKPHLQAQIVIPNEVASPKELDVEMKNNIKEAIQQAAGIEIKLIIEGTDNQ